MSTSATTLPGSPEQNRQFQANFRDIQKQSIWMVAGAQLLLGILLIYAGLENPQSVWLAHGGLLLVAGVGVAWVLQNRNFDLAAMGLSAGLLSAILHAVLVGRYAPAAFLLPLPAGLLTILLGTRLGVLLGLTISLGLIQVPPAYLALPLEQRLMAAAAIWGVIGLILLVLHPLLRSVEWVWLAYLNNTERLNEARAYQQQLQQSLADLASLNLQLTRLNHLTQNLRLEAENERQAKRQFVANVSHEFRTPLNMIIGFCEMILKNPEGYGRRAVPPSLLADLEVVMRNSQHLSSLIDDVLDLSQIEANQMALSKEWTSIHEILNTAVVAIRLLYSSKKLSLELVVPDNLPLVYCDRTRIREVLLNLLSNAGRFTQEGGVRLGVQQDDNWVTVTVSDTGPGITPEGKEKLFQPFQQLDNSIRRRYGGTGLGLAISKSFVELHDGKMWVESQVGQGTTFFFRLPVVPLTPLKGGPARWFNQYPVLSDRTHLPRAQVTLRPRVVVVDHSTSLSRLLNQSFN